MRVLSQHRLVACTPCCWIDPPSVLRGKKAVFLNVKDEDAEAAKTSALAKTKAIEWLEALRALVLESCVGILDLAESELGDQILWKGKPFGQSFRYTSKNARSSRASHDVL